MGGGAGGGGDQLNPVNRNVGSVHFAVCTRNLGIANRIYFAWAAFRECILWIEPCRKSAVEMRMIRNIIGNFHALCIAG